MLGVSGRESTSAAVLRALDVGADVKERQMKV
jgi:hypothetical protein